MIVRARPDIDTDLIRKLIKRSAITPILPESNLLFFDSGCSALQFLLERIGGGKKVGIQVFTCPTILDAIKKAGDIPVFMDIDEKYYTTRYEQILSLPSETDIIIISHLFGIPNPDYLLIKDWANKNNKILIDDLCQTYLGKIGDDYLESISDFYFYSFFIDKPIPGMKGGALKIDSNDFYEVKCNYNNLSKECETYGKFLLKKLWIQYNLISPELYQSEIRTHSLIEDFVIKLFPIGLNCKYLRSIFSMKLYRFLANSFPHKKERVIKRMSDVQIYYITSRLESFNNNIKNLYAFIKSHPNCKANYLDDSNIHCSIAQRAIINTEDLEMVKKTLMQNGIECGLHNWPTLLDNSSKYINASKTLKNNLNIPVWKNGLYK